jgi:transglutaminase-like putative cysteine protease
MPTDATFRFSTLLALSLSCVAVAYAEYQILPEVAIFAALAILGLGVLYFLESRVRLLSIPAANRLGAAIALAYVAWCAYRVQRELATQEFKNMGWQMLVVALCGPLLMVTIVAKVARSDKHAGDYWWLHGIALTGIAVSSAFAEERASFVLVGLYLAATVWSLTLLHLGRASGAVPPIPGDKQPARKAVTVSADPTGHRTDFRPALLWAALALAAAIPFYLLTPRSEELKIDFGKPRVEVGYAADQMVDLNQEGTLTTNTEVAFEFTATNPDGSPCTDVSPGQRFRGKSFRQYVNGEWKDIGQVSPPISHARGDRARSANMQVPRTGPWTEPRLGPGQFTITYEVPSKLGYPPPLADPVIWEPGQPAPVATLTEQGPRGWTTGLDGTFSTLVWRPMSPAPTFRYVQVYRRLNAPDVGPPFRFVYGDDDHRLTPLQVNPVPGVTQYANAVVDGAIASGRLPKDCRDEQQKIKPRYREAVARLFVLHLSNAASFNYTTDLKRADPKIDPVEDFLINTKAGHCERFAAALVLMLRSQGIPAIYVLGFRGCEPGEPGRYIVRQEFAHAWVEAIIPKADEPEDPKDPRSRVYHWVTLDPTPGLGQEAAQERPWWGDANDWLQAQFQAYVKEYTPERRRQALAALAEKLSEPQALAVIALAVALAAAARLAVRRLRRPAAPAAEPPRPFGWFGDLLALLQAHGITPRAGETLLEYAAAADGTLRDRGCAEVADVPLAWVAAYYQERFGGIAPADARLAELSARLEALRRALDKPQERE